MIIIHSLSSGCWRMLFLGFASTISHLHKFFFKLTFIFIFFTYLNLINISLIHRNLLGKLYVFLLPNIRSIYETILYWNVCIVYVILWSVLWTRNCWDKTFIINWLRNIMLIKWWKLIHSLSKLLFLIGIESISFLIWNVILIIHHLSSWIKWYSLLILLTILHRVSLVWICFSLVLESLIWLLWDKILKVGLWIANKIVSGAFISHCIKSSKFLFGFL